MESTRRARPLAAGDEKLALRIEHGDAAAMDALYAAIGKQAYGVARSIAGDRADEVVERSFERIRDEISSYDGRTTLAAWSWRIVRDEARRRRDERLRAPMLAALRDRPLLERRCVELVVLQGCSLREAAAALGIDRMDAARHLHDGLRSAAAVA
jgi:DNA-directed RNA polymerase specialized sigma24 family protein